MGLMHKITTALGFGSGRASLFAGGFDGASSGRRLSHFGSSRAHVNTIIAAAGADMNARARYLVRNNGYATSSVESFASNVIGDGIKPSAPIEDDDLKKSVQDLWRASVEVMDFDGVSNFYGLQQRVAREEFTTGEIFVRMHVERAGRGLPVPLTLQLIPSEMLPLHYNEQRANGNTIRQGIEFNKRGRRVAYWFFRKHPGDYTLPLDASGKEFERVPANQVLHIFDPKDAGQIRGYSRFASVMAKLFLLDQYDDAELDRKKTAALFAGFIKKTYPDETASDPIVGELAEQWDDMGIVDLEPGTLQYLKDNEDVTFSSPADVGGSYEAFQYRNLLHICAGLGMPYANVTSDMVKANYSNTRAALLEFRRRAGVYQKSIIVHQFCRAVWVKWLDLAVMSGAITLPDYEKLRWRYAMADWRPPRWDWVDPSKDIKAEREAVETGFKPRSKVQSEFGFDPEQVDDEIARDQKRADKLGLKIGTLKAGKDSKDENDGEEKEPPDGSGPAKASE